MRSYVVGDIHGRLDLLRKALGIALDHLRENGGGEARFICTGDMIDRGPNSAEVIADFRTGQIDTGECGLLHLIALQGNHEAMMVEVAGKNRIIPHLLDWWAGNGGYQTMESYGMDMSDVPLLTEFWPEQIRDDIKWLDCLPWYHIDQHRVFVHGGFRVINKTDGYMPMKRQDAGTCQWLRSDKVTDYGPFEGRHVVHGHEQFEDGPILLKNRTNLDTYAWRTGRLAIGVFDDDVPGGPVEILWAEGEPGVRKVKLDAN